MLYHGKLGKASLSRWHKYWFLAKDAFSDEVCSSFSTVHTTLEYEESPELAEGLKRLEEGFPETLVLDIFCDSDVLVKAGLSKGIDNFPDIDLATLLRAKDGKAVVPNQVSYLEVISGIDSSARCWPPNLLHLQSLQPPVGGISDQSMGPEGRSSPLLPTPTPADPAAVNLGVLSPEPIPPYEAPPSLDDIHMVPSWNFTKESSRASEGLASWADREKGFENNHPFFVDLPYTLPSGLQITKDSVSKPTASLTAEMLKNCMLRPSVLGVLGTQPLNLFDNFSYHQIKATEVAYALSLRLNNSSHRDEEERENLLADAREASEVYKSEGDMLKKHIRELHAEVNEYNLHLTEAQSLVKGFNDKVGVMENQLRDLQKALDNSVERFKWSEEYRVLVKGDTATLLRSFCQRVATDYPSISSHFTNFVTSLGEDYMVSLFDELPEEEPAFFTNGRSLLSEQTIYF
ncbi:hypothetical protein LIER_15737 [Lithospermum erythrorhizon]|uniref:Uncharacterized protein n=1 Tax=Lithospermum erythrorhizon TaxID=34254 RepID=A0AAV3Q5X8_LITER